MFFRLTAEASQFLDGALLVEPQFAPAPVLAAKLSNYYSLEAEPTTGI